MNIFLLLSFSSICKADVSPNIFLSLSFSLCILFLHLGMDLLSAFPGCIAKEGLKFLESTQELSQRPAVPAGLRNLLSCERASNSVARCSHNFLWVDLTASPLKSLEQDLGDCPIVSFVCLKTKYCNGTQGCIQTFLSQRCFF